MAFAPLIVTNFKVVNDLLDIVTVIRLTASLLEPGNGLPVGQLLVLSQ